MHKVVVVSCCKHWAYHAVQVSYHSFFSNSFLESLPFEKIFLKVFHKSPVVELTIVIAFSVSSCLGGHQMTFWISVSKFYRAWTFDIHVVLRMLLTDLKVERMGGLLTHL